MVGCFFSFFSFRQSLYFPLGRREVYVTTSLAPLLIPLDS